MRLSSNEEHADCRNNVIYVSADGSALAMLGETGDLALSHNWLKPGSVDSHDSFGGTITDDGTSVTGASPGFADEASQDYHLADGSPCINAGTALDPAVLPDHDVVAQYVTHQAGEGRPVEPPLDIGAFELCTSGACDTPDAGVGGAAQGGSGQGNAGTGGSGTGATSAPTAAPGDDGGCGCRLRARERGGWGWLVLSLVGVGAARRRRLRRRP